MLLSAPVTGRPAAAPVGAGAGIGYTGPASMDLDALQLAGLFTAFALVNVWACRRLRVGPSGARPRTPLLSVATALAVGAALFALVTRRSEDGFLLALLLAPVQLITLAVRFFRYNRSRGRPVPLPRLVFGNLVLLAIPLTAALAAGEVWFRFVHDTTDSIGYTKVARRWLERHYRFNRFGYRDDVDYDLVPKAGRRRVSFVGDSFTAGHGIVDVRDRFANVLRARHPEWEVHVLAKNGHDTAAEVEELRVATANGYVLDEVVLVYCLNDVMDLLPHWQETLRLAARQAEQRLPVFDSSYLLDTIYYRVAIARLPGVGDYFSFVGEAYRGEAWERQAQRLRALRAVVEAAGGRLRVVTWPFLNALGPDYPHRAIHVRLASFWSAEGVPHLDLLPVLADRAPAELVVNAADAHPNERASALAADAIDAWLVPLLAAPRDR